MNRAELVQRGRRLEWLTLSWNLVEGLSPKVARRGEDCCDGDVTAEVCDFLPLQVWDKRNTTTTPSSRCWLR
jgi:hypothetical protein